MRDEYEIVLGGPIIEYKNDGSKIIIDFSSGRYLGKDLEVHPCMYQKLLDKVAKDGLTCAEWGAITLGFKILKYSLEGKYSND